MPLVLPPYVSDSSGDDRTTAPRRLWWRQRRLGSLSVLALAALAAVPLGRHPAAAGEDRAAALFAEERQGLPGLPEIAALDKEERAPVGASLPPDARLPAAYRPVAARLPKAPAPRLRLAAIRLPNVFLRSAPALADNQVCVLSGGEVVVLVPDDTGDVPAVSAPGSELDFVQVAFYRAGQEGVTRGWVSDRDLIDLFGTVPEVTFPQPCRQPAPAAGRVPGPEPEPPERGR